MFLLVSFPFIDVKPWEVREDDLIKNYSILKSYVVVFAGRPLPTVKEHNVSWLVHYPARFNRDIKPIH